MPGKSPTALFLGLPAVAFCALVGGVLCIALAFGGTQQRCGGEAITGTLAGGVPEELVPIYQEASAKYRLGPKGPAMLASINFTETAFGTNVNVSSAGAQGWMQFMPETWAAYGVDANGDGAKDPYDPEDAIHAAARYLRASGAPGKWHDAIFAYNHAEWYVEKVMGDFRRFRGVGSEQVSVSVGACTPSVGDNALLQKVERVFEPRAYKPLPAKYWVGGGPPQAVDARIWPNAVWLLETYELRVTAAREDGHMSHGDGTAMDIVPAGPDWKSTTERAALDLGWTPGCASSGVAPACPLVPAIRFIGYNGYPSHGDPEHVGDNAHLHVSWNASGSPCGAPCGPWEWVLIFPLTAFSSTNSERSGGSR